MSEAKALVCWVGPKDHMPAKPGKASYEYVDCLIVYKGEVLMRPWNCEHLCFDDEHYDDFFCGADEIDWWMSIPKIPERKSDQ